MPREADAVETVTDSVPVDGAGLGVLNESIERSAVEGHLPGAVGAGDDTDGT
jgi:hypothetical protein